MRKVVLFIGLSVVVLLLAAGGCTPKAAPLSTAPLPPQAPVPSAKVETPEEAAWARVVEAAKTEGKLTAYAFTWVGDIGLAVASAFERRSGIKLEIVTGRGAEFTERLKVERRMGRIVGDMTEGSGLLISNMKPEGLLAAVAADLPVLQERDVWWVDPWALDPADKAVLGYRQTIYGAWINANLVKPGEEPQSWQDLLKPRWKGKMTLMEPRLNAGPSLFAAAKLWNEGYVKALYQQGLRFPPSTVEAARMLSKGEADLDIIGTDASHPQFLAEGAPLGALGMAEGNPIVLGGIAAIAKSPHPNATKVFINWVLSREGQEITGRLQSNRMVRRDVPDFRPPAAQAKLANPIAVSSQTIDEGNKLFRERWFDKVVGR